MRKLDFDQLNQILKQNVRDLLAAWLPGGRLIGSEYTCASLMGGRGDSLKFNIHKCQGSDFATGEKFGDLISLYAQIHQISQGEAFKQLSESVNFNSASTVIPSSVPQSVNLIPPPKDAPAPPMSHYKHGAPSASWCYRASDGSPMFYVARYEVPDGKELYPWSWTGAEWVAKAWPTPRPLYGLDELAKRPEARVLIVEGESSCEAAKELLGITFVVLTWPNGSAAVSKADWTPLYGRRILIWPDADKAGMKAGYQIAALLTPHCPEVKILEVLK